MNKANYSLDKFLEKVSALPVVKQMVNEEIQRTDAENFAARLDCINRAEAHMIEVGKAQQNLDSAVASFKAAEEKVTPYKIRMIAAERQLNDVISSGAAAARELHLIHGEQHTARMWLVLSQLQNHCKTQIENLTSNLSPHYFIEGRLNFKPVNPSIKPALENQKLRLKAIEQALSTAQLLVHAKIPATELKTQIDALLAAVGYVPPAAEVFNDEPVL